MALNTCKMWSNGLKIAFFPKNCKKSHNGWGFRPQTPKATGGWGPRPQTPVCDTFELHKLSQHVLKVRSLHFSTISLSPHLLQSPGYVQTGNNDFRSSILRYLCPTKTFYLKNFDDVISCDLWFRPPTIKNSGYVNELEIAWKKFLKTFFFGNRLRLCPWPWPRAFLSLASRGSVLGKAVLCLSLGFFFVF